MDAYFVNHCAGDAKTISLIYTLLLCCQDTASSVCKALNMQFRGLQQQLSRLNASHRVTSNHRHALRQVNVGIHA